MQCKMYKVTSPSVWMHPLLPSTFTVYEIPFPIKQNKQNNNNKEDEDKCFLHTCTLLGLLAGLNVHMMSSYMERRRKYPWLVGWYVVVKFYTTLETPR